MIQTVFQDPQSGFEWIDVVSPSADELHQIAQKYNLHPSAVKDCLDAEHLPKQEQYSEVTFLITRAYDDGAPQGPTTVQEMTRKIALFISDQRVLTIHRTEQIFLTRLRENIGRLFNGRKKELSFSLVHEIVRGVLSTYEKALDRTEQAIEVFESVITDEQTPASGIRDMYGVKRTISMIKRMLRLTTESLREFEFDDVEKNLILKNDLEEIQSLFVYADDLHESTQDLINTHIALASQKTNEVMRILTLFSVFFMPLTFIVGIYGMNFHFMPELSWPFGYPLVLLSMAFISLVIYVWFRRKGWLN